MWVRLLLLLLNLINYYKHYSSIQYYSYNTYWFNYFSNYRYFFFFYTLSATTLIKTTSAISIKFYIYFIKKESYYTKLKYSRVPQFDTSSGAVASLISGFYGFLVCEKFGFEMIDSGDFFFIMIYLVLISYLFMTLLKFINGDWNIKLAFRSIIKSFFIK